MKNAIRQTFRENLRRTRVDRGMTQDELAESSGIDYKYIQKIEGKDTPNVTLDTIARLARALKIAPYLLLK